MRMSSMMSWSLIGGLSLSVACAKDEPKKDDASGAAKAADAKGATDVKAADGKSADAKAADAKAPADAVVAEAPPAKPVGKPIAYVPAAATVVGGVDLSALQGTPSWKESQALIAAENAEMLAAMSACNLGLEKWKSVTFGVDANGGSEQVTAVIVAEGLGKPESLECAKGKLKERDGKDPWTARPDGKTLELQDGQVAHVVDADTVVITGKAWAAEVEALVKGEGKGAADGALKDVIARTDTTRHVWFAGKLPEDAKASAQMLGDIGNPQDVAGWLDLGAGLEVWAAVGFGTADEAAKAKQATAAQLEAFKPLAVQMGVPQAVVDSVKLDTKDNAATITAKASTADLEVIQAQLMGAMGGMGGAPPMPASPPMGEAKAPGAMPSGGLGPDGKP